jgi:hypothetical protein
MDTFSCAPFFHRDPFILIRTLESGSILQLTSITSRILLFCLDLIKVLEIPFRAIFYCSALNVVTYDIERYVARYDITKMLCRKVRHWESRS